MANPGAGSKFVSVNLNKSYGQRSGNLGGGNRIRSGGAGGGGGGGGGMVVLSRSRGSVVGVQKGGPKLSVPPPLNLPSLRKEHERTDLSALGGGAGGGGSSGAGARPASSGIGWTKPVPVVVQEKEVGSDQPLGVGSQGSDRDQSDRVSRDTRGNGVYMPPSARSNVPSVAASGRDFAPVQRAVVLRGEDFPSLQATLPTASGVAQKQKDNVNTKQNQKATDEPEEQMMGNSYLRPPAVMQPQNQSSRLVGKAADEKEGVNHRVGNSRNSEQLRKQDDFFPTPLPLVRLNHTSDWADDERDTGNGLPDRDRDQGYSRSEFSWERDFDFPRSSVLPRTSIHDHSEGRGPRHEEVRRPPSGGFVGGNTYNRDVRTPSREGRDGSSWRSPSLVKEGFGGVGNGIGARPLNINRENGKQNKYGQSSFGDTSRDGFNSGFSGTQDSKFARRDLGYGQGVRQTGNHVTESYGGRRVEQTRQDYYGKDLPSHRGDSFQNGSFKGLFTNDPIPSVSKEKEKHLTTGKHYFEEPFAKDFGSNPEFDGRDPLTGVLVSVVKKKKDALKQADYHDPVRDSFEAELERVQKLQEQERQRIIEEQARALELARKEEEERERVVREEEERRRRHEEEVKEAAWRAEQERLEAMRKAEEHKVAREEEKRRMLLEEERRKEAARKKLMELEARIARRQAEVMKENESSSNVKDERIHGVFQDKDVPRVADVVDWEDGERMVERITSSASSDSSNFNRSFEMSSRPHFYRDGDSVFLDKGKPSNSWRRDVFDNGSSSAFIWQDQDNAYRSPKRDVYGAGRSFARKEFNGGSGILPVKASGRGGMSDPRMVDEFSHQRGNRWNLSGDVDPYNRNPDFDPEFHDNFPDKFNDMGWGLGRPHVSHHPSYSERPYQNSDADGFSPFAKSRHSMRQPRVLPPPSLAAMNKNTFKSQIEPHRSSSGFRDSEISYHHVTRNSEPILQMGYEASYQDERDRSRTVDSQEENARFQDQKEAKTVSPRCDSQSSLSVSSAPSSPTHLSHDDLEDSRESPSLPTAAEGEEAHLSENENAASLAEIETVGKVGHSSSLSPLEDEEWDIENHRDLLEQEEYDEEENGYREDDEVHEEGDENVDLHQEFEDLQLEEKGTASAKDNLGLDFDESVDVVMPSDDNSESNPGNGEKTIGIRQVSVGVSEEVASLDGLPGIGQSIQSGSNSPKVGIESSQMTQEAEITPVSAPHNSDASLSSSPENTSPSILTVAPHQPHSSSVEATLPSTTQPATSMVSVRPSQTEVPVKLQFGLFSGPSLIPSPVSAIQIGSIQMPLHLNPPVGPSLTQLHPPQPPFFQFGQLRYASPIPQGIVPLGPQSMSFVQSSSPAQYSVNPNQNSSVSNQEGQDLGIQNNSVSDKPTASSVDKEPGGQKLLDQSQDSCRVANVQSVRQRAENEGMVSHSRADSSLLGVRSTGPEVASQVERGYQSYERKNYRSNVTKESHNQLHVEHSTSQFISRSPGPISGNRGKRYVVKNSGSRLSHPVSESSYTDFRGSQRRGRPKLQRTEFRVRENVDKRQRESVVLANYPEADKSSFNGKVYGTSVQSGASKAFKQMSDAEDLNAELASAQNIGSESRREKHADKEIPVKKVSSLYVSHSREGNPKRNDTFDEDIDAPLQSGIVRVFNQPGIEAPSDDDDFIEVRSKRQMLNDRREQREKEIKARSRIVKAPKKRRAVSQNSVASTKSNKTTLGGETSNSSYSKPVSNDCQSVERPTRFSGSIISPPLAPIGTPSANSDTQADIRAYTTKSTQPGSNADISTVGTSLVPSISFEKKNVMVDSIATSLSPWGNARVTQQVMALTQTQLDEAMTPARFEKQSTSVGDRTGAIIEQNQNKSFSSTSSPLNSLLAGERIQFGAVTSPNIFPLTSHVVSNGMGPPGSCRLDVPIEHNLSALENDCSLFFEKDKHLNESCVDLEDCEAEAEAEAAASAVAVAAISSDEIVGSGCSVSVSETKNFEGAENEGLTSESGETSNQQVGSQSRVDESLSVALPADLSVETPALSLWPSLPSPQHSTGQMISHFPVPPTHYPCYEMNPMLGGPIFAFGPHDETTGTQSQSQKSNVPGSGPLGAWQQCHSGVDSFYGPPAGFTGPFISPSGGIPGVQGPPHMVVYNHFTPVGQFGQVGLSFMGATYIPSGKQPDWKHNPTTSTSIGEGDMNNMHIPSVQHNPTSMPSSIQHLAPGSPLLPLASPLTMFDMSPFQSSTDVSAQGRWSHFPASPLHSAPMSMPTPQHVEGVLSTNFSQGSSTIEQSSGNRFLESGSSAASDNGRNFSVATSAAVTQFPDELGLLDTSSTTTTQVSVSRPASYKATIMNGKGQGVAAMNLSRSTTTNAGDSSTNNSNNSNQTTHPVVTSRSSQQQIPTQQFHQPTGYTSQRGTGVSQKVASGSEWSQRKMGYQGRNQSAGAEKKVKQIYVAKPATSRTSTNSSS